MAKELQTLTWKSRFFESHAQGVARPHDPNFGTVFVRGDGARLFDVDGKEWLDLVCGYSASNFGHNYRPLVEAARQQLTQLTHLTGDIHIERVQLAESLIAHLGPGMEQPRVILNSTGARAVETAWKAATAYRKGKILALSPGFHGRSIATAAISDTQQASLSGLLDGQTLLWPEQRYPYCGYCGASLNCVHCGQRNPKALLDFINAQAQDLSCVVVEPAVGARGYLFPEADFFQRLREVTRQHGILLIADEVQTGLGRCGDWLLSHRQGWQADLVVVGKSLGGGIVPVSAVVGHGRVMNRLAAGVESETFAGTPFACAIANCTMELLSSGDMFEQANRIGAHLRAIVSELQLSSPELNLRVEGEGAVCVANFAQSPECKDVSWAQKFADACYEQRLKVHLTGVARERVVMLPPIVLQEGELELIEARLRLAIVQIVESLRSQE